MSHTRLSVEATQDAITGTQPTVTSDDVARPPVLITEHEVMFGTAAAVSPPSAPISRRMIGALRVVGAALRPPPPWPHYRHDAAYLERARMAREMGRL